MKVLQKLSLLVFTSVCLVFGGATMAFAEPQWTTLGALTADVFNDYSSGYKYDVWNYIANYCLPKSLPLLNAVTHTRSSRICELKGRDVSLAVYSASDYDGRRLAIKMPGSNVYRTIEMDMQNVREVVVSSDTNTVAVAYTSSARPGHSWFEVYPDITKAITADYRLDSSKAKAPLDVRLSNGLLHSPEVYDPVVSGNGRYVLGWTSAGLVKVDTHSGQATLIMLAEGDGGFSIGAWAISDDGRYIIHSPQDIRDTQNCGDPYDGRLFEMKVAYVVQNPCLESADLALPAWQAVLESGDMREMHFGDFRIASDNSWVAFDAYHDGYRESDGEWSFAAKLLGVVVYAANQAELSKRPTYIALGDSYSSGEGDIGRKANKSSYYLPGTQGDKGCHVSSRSYPFLLGSAWGIPSSKVKSVACSGARVDPDMDGKPVGYKGQEGGSRTGLDLAQDRLNARDFFTPGMLQQIDFVRTYQPQVVTLTGGGNDIGFANVLHSCASSVEICEYAKPGSKLNKTLYQSIDTQYYKSTKLLYRLKSVSPQTKIILVGYPSFITESGGGCPVSSGFLAISERKMIGDMVKRVNSMLQRAAYDAGVQYVSVENSLHGGRMCEGAKYMTTVADNRITKIATEQEQFHPNAEGHKKIASTIVSSGVYNSSTLGTPGTYTPPTTYVPTSRDGILPEDVYLRNAKTNLTVKTGLLGAGTSFNVVMYSDPINLGTFTAYDDGSADAAISLAGVPPGNHTLTITGTGPDGQPVEYYQFIQIHASADDADGDGILDDQDNCNFIDHWYDEQTGVDVCSTAKEAAASSLGSTSSARKDTSSGFAPSDKLAQASTVNNDNVHPVAMVVKTVQHSANGWLFAIISTVIVCGVIVLIRRRVYHGHDARNG